jgi:hypothetical protein
MPTKCGVPPAAVVAYEALPGFALHHCANSAKVFTLSDTAGPTL